MQAFDDRHPFRGVWLLGYSCQNLWLMAMLSGPRIGLMHVSHSHGHTVNRKDLYKLAAVNCNPSKASYRCVWRVQELLLSASFLE